jgi:large subunit ribosomal protein L21
MSKFAVVETGGKQYQVEVGKKVRVEKLPIAEGEAVTFDKVLLAVDGEKVQVGMPYLKGATVEGTLLNHGREEKKLIFRYHSKTRYRKKKGHRQFFSSVEVTKI